MFKSYEQIKYLGYDKERKKYRYQYKIVDSDFEEAVVSTLDATVRAFGADIAVVETYRKKNLPVVPNLILYWQYCSKKYDRTIDQVINWSKQYNQYHLEYEDEINKYLLLL